jgi:hypothetical protein
MKTKKVIIEPAPKTVVVEERSGWSIFLIGVIIIGIIVLIIDCHSMPASTSPGNVPDMKPARQILAVTHELSPLIDLEESGGSLSDFSGEVVESNAVCDILVNGKDWQYGITHNSVLSITKTCRFLQYRISPECTMDTATVSYSITPSSANISEN